jgi:hypothetical protein
VHADDDYTSGSRETDRSRVVESVLAIPDGFKDVLDDEGKPVLDDEGRPKREPKHREVIRRHRAILFVKGPSFDSLAIVWGAERLAPLWAPSPVPPDLARAAAVGFAPADVRARWERMRGPLKDAAARSWGEERLRGYAETLRNKG